MVNRLGWLALGLSLAAHVALLGGVELRLAATTAPEPLLPEPFMQAELIVPPPPPAPVPALAAPAPPPRAAPRRAPPPAPAPLAVAAAPAALAPVNDVPASADLPAALPEPAPPPELAAESPAPALADAQSWPRRGSILFRVMLGDKGFEVGQSEHSWSHDLARYQMQVELQTTGLTAILRRFHYTQRSEGEVSDRGLRPTRFSVEQLGRATDVVDFNWAEGMALIRRGGREARAHPIAAGDQDVLSVWHQIGITGLRGLPAKFTVFTNKRAKAALFEAVGTEVADLPIGRLDTLHLRAAAEDRSLVIDIWLARRYGMLPVRIRIADDDGEVLDQQAIQLRLTPVEARLSDPLASTAAASDTPPGAHDEAGNDGGDDPAMIELKEVRRDEPVHYGN